MVFIEWPVFLDNSFNPIPVLYIVDSSNTSISPNIYILHFLNMENLVNTIGDQFSIGGGDHFIIGGNKADCLCGDALFTWHV